MRKVVLTFVDSKVETYFLRGVHEISIAESRAGLLAALVVNAITGSCDFYLNYVLDPKSVFTLIILCSAFAWPMAMQYIASHFVPKGRPRTFQVICACCFVIRGALNLLLLALAPSGQILMGRYALQVC